MNDELKQALEFAQNIADREIEAIVRLHNRSLTYIGFVVAVIVGGFGIFGWLGYSNLRNTAVGVATSTVRKETEQQVREKLTSENLNEIVAGQLQGTTKKKLDDALRTEISTTLKRPILETAQRQTETLLKDQFQQRHLTKDQATLFIEAINREENLKGVPVEISNGFDPESLQYAWSLRHAIDRTHLQAGASLGLSKPTTKNPSYDGEDIVFGCDKEGEELCHSLKRAFATASITAKEEIFDSGQLQVVSFADGKAPDGPAKFLFISIYVNQRTLTF